MVGVVESAMPVRNSPPKDLITGQVSIVTSPTVIVAERPGRRNVLIVLGTASPMFIGGSTVSIATGLRLVGVDGTGILIPTEQAIYGIVSAGAVDVSFMELY